MFKEYCGKERDKLLMLNVHTEGVEEDWTDALFEYPRLVKEASASETEIQGEIFLGFPYEHDPYKKEGDKRISRS